MPAATINLRVEPFRMLTKREAAFYCRQAFKTFAVVCPVTPVVMPDGQQLYDVQDLDRWIDGLKGDAGDADAIVRRLK
jgi:hypothetical protein